MSNSLVGIGALPIFVFEELQRESNPEPLFCYKVDQPPLASKFFTFIRADQKKALEMASGSTVNWRWNNGVTVGESKVMKRRALGEVVVCEQAYKAFEIYE